MKKKFRRLLALTLALLMVLVVAGCGETETPAPDTESATTSGTPAPTNDGDLAPVPPVATPGSGAITLMASQNWIKDIDRELFKKFEAETGIEVKVLVTPDNGYDTLLSTSMSDSGNAVDIFMYQAGTPMVSLGIPDIALDLSDQAWSGNLEDWAKAASSSDGKLYGFNTWGIDYEGILYNKTYFAENKLEVPTTWEGFIALCDQILALNKMPLYEGINGVWHTQTWFYALTPMFLKDDPDAASKLSASKDFNFADLPSAKEGLTQLSGLFGAKENGKPKYYTNDGQSEDWFGSYTALTNRDAIMMCTYTAYPAELKESGSTDEWGMFPIPVAGNDTVVANGGGIAKFINKNSQNIEDSKKLLDFLAQPENLDAYYAARADLVTASFKGVTTVSATSATAEAIERSKSEPPTMLMRDMLYWDPDMYQYFQGFAEGTTTPDQFIENIDNYRAVMFEAAGE